VKENILRLACVVNQVDVIRACESRGGGDDHWCRNAETQRTQTLINEHLRVSASPHEIAVFYRVYTNGQVEFPYLTQVTASVCSDSSTVIQNYSACCDVRIINMAGPKGCR
jgi:hypothetical protein